MQTSPPHWQHENKSPITKHEDQVSMLRSITHFKEVSDNFRHSKSRWKCVCTTWLYQILCRNARVSDQWRKLRTTTVRSIQEQCIAVGKSYWKEGTSLEIDEKLTISWRNSRIRVLQTETTKASPDLTRQKQPSPPYKHAQGKSNDNEQRH